MSGWSQCASGSADAGISQLRQGLLDWAATGSVTYRTYYLGLLAEALGSSGHVEEARRVVDESLSLVEQTDERFYEAELCRLRGELLVRDPHGPAGAGAAAAKEAFDRAMTISRPQEAKSLELRAAMSQARLERTMGSGSEAARVLADTIAFFTQGFDTPDLSEARAFLKSAS